MASLARGNPTPARFMGARLARIMIPFWASMLVVVAVVVAHKLIGGVNDVTALPGSPLAVVASVILATEPFTSLRTINWVYWSLSYEVIFYALVAIGVLIRRPTLALAVLLPLSSVAEIPQWDLIDGTVAVRPLFWVDQFPFFALASFWRVSVTISIAEYF